MNGCLLFAVLAKGKKMLDEGTIQSCLKDMSDGKVSFKMETLKAGRTKNISLNPNGNVSSFIGGTFDCRGDRSRHCSGHLSNYDRGRRKEREVAL
jgi:hypothetical protein